MRVCVCSYVFVRNSSSSHMFRLHENRSMDLIAYQRKLVHLHLKITLCTSYLHLTLTIVSLLLAGQSACTLKGVNTFRHTYFTIIC